MSSHDESKKSKCPVCGKTFSRLDTMKSHAKHVHGLFVTRMLLPPTVTDRSAMSNDQESPMTEDDTMCTHRPTMQPQSIG